jgi:hypothetical protein
VTLVTDYLNGAPNHESMSSLFWPPGKRGDEQLPREYRRADSNAVSQKLADMPVKPSPCVLRHTS